MPMTKITIATVCFNSEATIERTLRSVEEQDYPAVEHLFIDGASTDGTLRLLNNYQTRSPHEVVVVSEKDHGLYDAMNKALARATGDYIVFLNAGDRLHSTDTLRIVAEKAAAEGSGVVYGETDLVDNDGHFLRHRRLQAPQVLTSRSFLQGMLVCHQSFYAKVSIARTTPYNLNYRLSADVDWCIRIMKEAERESLPLTNTHAVLTDYLSEGMTTQHHRASLIERFHVMAHHYGLATTVGQHVWFALRSVLKR